MDVLRPILENWFLREPMAILWMVIAAALLFGMAFVRSRGEDDGRAWTWFRRLLEALLPSLLFVGLLGMFYFLLNSNYANFEDVCGSFVVQGSDSNQAWQAERDVFGGVHIQQDLRVVQYVPLPEGEVVQSDASDDQPAQESVVTEMPIAQTSIVGFDGMVTIDLEDDARHVEEFSTYALQADYRYDIVNPTDIATRAVFSLPLSPGTILYKELEIMMDGEDVSYLYDNTGALTWTRQLSPGEEASVSIQYAARGMDGFLFEVAEQRRITNLRLNLNLDDSEY